MDARRSSGCVARPGYWEFTPEHLMIRRASPRLASPPRLASVLQALPPPPPSPRLSLREYGLHRCVTPSRTSFTVPTLDSGNPGTVVPYHIANLLVGSPVTPASVQPPGAYLHSYLPTSACPPESPADFYFLHTLLSPAGVPRRAIYHRTSFSSPSRAQPHPTSAPETGADIATRPAEGISLLDVSEPWRSRRGSHVPFLHGIHALA